MDANSDRTLLRVSKGKLTDWLRDCGIYADVPESAWRKKSVVEPCD